jgi:hypothetical protein
MAGTCPHCGTKLPAMVDAFCPECRNDLGEAPSSEPPARGPSATRRVVAELFDVWHLVKIGILLVVVLLFAVLELMDGKPSPAITLGACVVFVAVAESLRRSLRRAKRAEQDYPSHDPRATDHGKPE